jgi:hypothetical protein
VAEIVHTGFNADARDGGLAFVCDKGFVIFAFDGGNVWSIDPGGDSERLREIEASWRDNQHRNRSITHDDLNDWLRAADAALVAASTASVNCQSRRDDACYAKPVSHEAPVLTCAGSISSSR